MEKTTKNTYCLNIKHHTVKGKLRDANISNYTYLV